MSDLISEDGGKDRPHKAEDGSIECNTQAREREVPSAIEPIDFASWCKQLTACNHTNQEHVHQGIANATQTFDMQNHHHQNCRYIESATLPGVSRFPKHID